MTRKTVAIALKALAVAMLCAPAFLSAAIGPMPPSPCKSTPGTTHRCPSPKVPPKAPARPVSIR